MKYGTVAVIGRPNTGKSSIINALTGEKVSIVSPRPQTTREQAAGIVNLLSHSGALPHGQMVLVDTPGIFKPKKSGDEVLSKSVRNAAGGADVLLYVIDGSHTVDERDENNIALYARRELPIVLAINKIDICGYEKIYPMISHYSAKKGITEIIPVSALKNINIDKLSDILAKLLPDGEPVYGEDEYTTNSAKFMSGEIIREKMLYLLSEEVPHGVTVEITEFKKRKGKDLFDISADITCDKENHKQIIIGKGGSMLKQIGQRARPDIEKLVGLPVNLQLFVKIRK
jgi:GTP-binding protein Era